MQIYSYVSKKKGSYPVFLRSVGKSAHHIYVTIFVPSQKQRDIIFSMFVRPSFRPSRPSGAITKYQLMKFDESYNTLMRWCT